MKLKISILPAVLLALVMAGCKQPTDPSYSPDGQRLVFEKGGKLILRTSQGDRTISSDIEGPVSWSPDGSKLAFSQDNKTTIYDVGTGQSVGSTKYVYPYSWQHGMLMGVRAYGNRTDATIFMVSPDSAEPNLEVVVPFQPDRIDPIGNGESLIWAGGRAYYFDGLQPVKLPQLNELGDIVPQRSGGQWLLARSSAHPHAHRQTIVLYGWSGDLQAKPVPIGEIDIAAEAGLAKLPSLIRDIKLANGRFVATLLSAKASASDMQSLVSLVEKYDLLNHLDRNPVMPARDEKRLKAIMNRTAMVRIAVTGTRGGKWTELARSIDEPSRPQRKPSDLRVEPDLRVGISDDGSKVAVSSGTGTRTFSFPNR